MKTKVLQLISKTNFFTEKDLRKTLSAANELEFNDFGVSEKTIQEDNWFGLFLDEENAYWTIKMTSKSSYHLFVENEKICKIDKELTEKLDSFREWELGSDERSIQTHAEYLIEYNELWSNYGFGRI